MQENSSEKRLRVMFDQILPDIVDDIKIYKDVKFRVAYVGKLQDVAYDLVSEQEKYDTDDITSKFDSAYQEIEDIIKCKENWLEWLRKR